MRVLTSALLSATLFALSAAEGFGRFGYVDRPKLPGIQLDTDGFVSKSAGADKFWFAAPGKHWKPASTNEFGQTILLGAQALGPQKARFSTWQPGVSLLFQEGMQFRLGSTGCPYLTWGEGTVAEGVPTPDASWVLISFRSAQPPILIVLESGQTSFKFSGKSGAWILRAEKPIKGWVRIIQPIGTAEVAANSAASLGKLTKRVFENISIWTQPAPQLLSQTITGDATSVEVAWKFDRPGAIVPIGAALANLGGYPVKVQTKIRRLSEWNDEGPIAVAEDASIRLRLPIRRVPLGRSVNVGKRQIAPLGTVSPIDLPSIVELALENILADRDIATFKTAEETLESFLTDASYAVEPITKQQLPYAASGAGMDLAACHALLMQTTTISNQASSYANSLFTSISWRRDAYHWRVAVDDRVLARKVGALAALAGFLCPEPERRLEGALFEAGLAAERGLSILESRRSGKQEPTFLEVMEPLRRYAFMRDIKVSDEDPFGKSLLSEIRVFGDASVSCEKQGDALAIQWQAPDTNAHQIVFASAYPIELELGNMRKLDVERALGLTQVRFVANQVGLCTANLRRPEWAKSLPSAVPVPHYSEFQK